MAASIETVENFWDNQPCNIKHSNSEIHSKDFFEEVSKKRYFVEPHIVDFANFAAYKDKDVLEIGCGIGTDSISFARAGARMTCLDLSSKSLEICKEGFKQYGLEGVFIHCNAENMLNLDNLLNKKYDLVYSFGVIHHTPYPEKVFQNIRKLLKDDGEMKIMLYAKNSWKKIMIDSGYDQYEAQNGCPIANTYTKEEIYDLLNGFIISDIKQCHIFKWKIPEYKRNEYVMEEWFASMPDKMREVLNNALGWHLCITAKLRY